MFILRIAYSLYLLKCLYFITCEIPRELGNFEAATENFQKALLLNQNHVQTLQLRGMMLYHHGSLHEALNNFKVSIHRGGILYIKVVYSLISRACFCSGRKPFSFQTELSMLRFPKSLLILLQYFLLYASAVSPTRTI